MLFRNLSNVKFHMETGGTYIFGLVTTWKSSMELVAMWLDLDTNCKVPDGLWWAAAC